MNFIKKLINHAGKKSGDWKTKVLFPFFNNSETVLDFGCGDLSLAKSLKKNFPELQFTGVDVTNFSKRPKNIRFVVYDGKTLPFKDNAFDTVIAFYVLHHCDDAVKSFKECARVAKNRVIIVESVYRYPLEIPFMKLMDWVYNRTKSESISLSYQFLSCEKWLKTFKKAGMKTKSKKIKNVFLPVFFPIGISYIFEVIKSK